MTRRVRQRILCEDDAGKCYWVEVVVHTHMETTPFGTYEVDGPPDCWLDAGSCYQPVSAIEAFDIFTIVDQGRVLTLRRVQKRRFLSSS